MKKLSIVLIATVLVLASCLTVTPISWAAASAKTVMIAAGTTHTLALKSDGTVWSWGSNSHGQLGDGTRADHYVPLQVKGLSGAIAVAVGGNMSAAVKKDGSVWVWGDTLSHVSSKVPMQVNGMKKIVSVGAGEDYIAALAKDGTVWTWGSNNNWTLGDPKGQYFGKSAGKVPGLKDVTKIAASKSQVLALKKDGSVWSWGKDLIGNGSDGGSQIPVRVLQGDERKQSPLTGAADVYAGSSNSFVIKKDGSVWGWGYNRDNAIVVDGARSYACATKLPKLQQVKKIGFGDNAVLVLKKDGSVWGWGSNGNGILGEGVKEDSAEPVKIKGLEGSVSNLWVSDAYSPTGFAQLTDGSIKVWGYNVDGQAGIGTSANIMAPVRTGIEDVARIITGRGGTFALKKDGTVWGWGYNEAGLIGPLSSRRYDEPVRIQGIDGAADISSMHDAVIVLKSDGTVWGWGRNVQGSESDEGTNSHRFIPVQVKGLSGATKVVAGSGEAFALLTDGSIWTWEYKKGIAGPIPALSGMKDIETAGMVKYALKNDGTVWAWGGSGYDLGLGDQVQNNRVDKPMRISALKHIRSIASGDRMTTAVDESGNVWYWGYFGSRQKSPKQLKSLKNVEKTGAFNDYITAIETDGTMWIWGMSAPRVEEEGRALSYREVDPATRYKIGQVQMASLSSHILFTKADGSVWSVFTNFHGELGNGTLRSSVNPVPVRGLTDVSQVIAGPGVSYAVKTDGTVWSWGNDISGSVGNGSGSLRIYQPSLLSGI